MATVNFSVRSNKNPANIYCRFIVGRKINIAIPIGLLINPEHWDQQNQKVRNVLAAKNKAKINNDLLKLKAFVFERYNNDYSTGEIIDKFWLEDVCQAFFNRPKSEKSKKTNKHEIYYTDFALWWLKEKSRTWLVSESSMMSTREINKYKSFISMVQEFQGRKKIHVKYVTRETITDFVKHLHEQGYASNTIKRHVSRFKFFLLRAEELQLSINPSFKQKVFTPKSEPIKEPYLNPDEIEKIFNHDFTDNPTLDNVRDNLIIACWTGLRISDFLGQLDISNFIDDEIQITTQKTKTPVVIPLHPQVKKILIKRNGKLPKKISDQKFNKHVKKVCKSVGINQVMKGSVYDKKSRRKVVDLYPKWKLITSHVGRRSFATNHYGKIPNSVIMGVAGWSKPEMMLHYIKKSNRDHAVELKKYWDEIYN